MKSDNFIPIEQHPLEPFLPKNGKLLMLGSFPPQTKRWCMDFYYPNYTNDMWRVFGTVFFNDSMHFVDEKKKTFKKEEIIGFLNKIGVGIYDTASAVRRLKDNASDKFLEVVKPTDIVNLLSQMPQCRNIVTTGQKATDTICTYFNISQPSMGGFIEFSINGNELFQEKVFHIYRMPSTSRAYPLSLQKKADVYSVMFNEIFNS